jgi:DNA-binding response OmpR family regulator
MWVTDPVTWSGTHKKESMSQTVLFVDDDAGLRTLMKLGLEREGFGVITATDGQDGIRKAYQHRPDAIILDVMMDKMDGWTTCQRLRQVTDTPIIMLTARTEEDDIVKGLSLGADDYLTKPCSFAELKARILALLRRSGTQTTDRELGVFDDGCLTVNLRHEIVLRRGQEVSLSPTESRLLMYLVSQRGRIVPHRELLVKVWGSEYARELSYLAVYIRYLRQKLEDDPSRPVYIRTRWKVGYYFGRAGDIPLSVPEMPADDS